MLDNLTKEYFIELRAQGQSYSKISKIINVSKPTLIEWSKEFIDQISNLRAIDLEDLQEKYFIHKRKRIEIFGNQLEAIKQELSSRDLKSISTEKLLDLLAKFTGILKDEETPTKFINTTSKSDFIYHEKMESTWEG